METSPRVATPALYFICYARADTRLVERIEAKLANRRRRGQLDCWRDRRNLDVGDRYSGEIREAIAAASGAVVLVGDDFYASDYIHTHEWPAIKARLDGEDNFRIFPLSTTALDSDDDLRNTYNFVNDPATEPLRHVDGGLRDAVLTRLSDQLAAHAATVPVTTEALLVRLPSPSRTVSQHVDFPQMDLTKLQPGLHAVPGLPSRFVEPDEVATVVHELAAGSTTGVTGVRGEGGTGKSVLAAAVARRVVADWPGGVHWITVGELATTEDVRQLQKDLLQSLGKDVDRQLRDVDEGKGELQQALQRRPSLVIVDDVWHRWQTRAFDVVSVGPSRLLFTTRFPEVLPMGSAAVDLQRLSPSDAATFLRQSTDGLPLASKDLQDVLGVAGGLRLALAVLSAAADAAGAWAEALNHFDGLAVRFGFGDDASSAHKALHVAVESLSDDDRRLLWRLAALPPDARIPATVLQHVWEKSAADTNALAGRLIERRLAGNVGMGLIAGQDDGDGLELHDYVLDFLILESPTSIDQTHLRLWEVAHKIADGSWTRLMATEPYLWERLVWHGCRAGLNTLSLTSLVSDVDWLVSRIERDGASAAEQDVRLVCTVGDIDPNTPLDRLRRVLRHNALFDELPSEEDLRVSLRCWADSLGIPVAASPRLVRVVEGSLPVPSAALRRTFQGHAGVVWAAAFDATGRRVVTAGTDGSARVWDTTTGELLGEIGAHTSAFWDAAFDSGGGRVATAGLDGTARVWDSSTGEVVAELIGHGNQVLGVAFHPEGHRLATASADGTARIWDIATGQTVIELAGHGGAAFQVAFHPDGGQVATAGLDGTARVWDSSTGEVVAELIGHGNQVLGVAFHPGGHRLATGSADGTARIWDIATGEAVAEYTLDVKRDPPVGSLNSAAASEGPGGGARPWDTITGHTITDITDGTNAIFGVAFDSAGDRLVTAGFDATARIWNVETMQLVSELVGHSGVLTAAEFDAFGHGVVTAGGDGTARLWDPNKIEGAADEPGRAARVGSLALDDSGDRLAAGSSDNRPSIWDATTGRQIVELEGHTNQVWIMAFDPKSNRIATGGADGTATIWDPTSGRSIIEFVGHDAGIWGVAFDPVGDRLATTSADCTARIWDATTGETILTLTGHADRLEGMGYAPDGQRLVTASFDCTARIWDTRSGETTAELIGHNEAVYAAVFDPSGSRVATTSYDGTARIWNAETGETTADLIGHTNQVWGVAFSDDGRRLATGSVDGTVRIWNTATGDPELTLGVATSGSIAWRGHRLAMSTGRHWAMLELSLPED